MKQSNDPLILSFDLSDEVFQTMLLPDSIVGPRTQIGISAFGELLSLLCYEHTAGIKSCSIWIMKEYSVVDSLYKQFKIGISGGIMRVLGIRNNGHVLLVVATTSSRGWMLSSYDPSSQQIKNLGIYTTANPFVVDTYEENLILLNKPNAAFSRRRARGRCKTDKTKSDNFNYSMDSKHDLVDDLTYDSSLPNGTTSDILIFLRHVR